MGLTTQEAAAIKLAVVRYGTVLYAKGMNAGTRLAANGNQVAAFTTDDDLEHAAAVEAKDVWGLVDSFISKPEKASV